MNIEIKKLNKKLDDFSLKNINISIPKGHIVGLIGENGAGKTTLIKCILDIMHKDSGEVSILGKTNIDDIKNDIGVLFDDSFMNENNKIKDINFLCKNIYQRWDEEKFLNYMNDFKIPLNKEFKKLSTGMKKKVEIAVSMSHNPSILILDEPTSGLDPIIRSEVLDMFQDFVEDNNNSILLSTHITSDLEHIADDIIFISDGEVLFNRPLKDIINNYVILEVPKKDINKIDKKIIIRYKENRLDYQILIDKKNSKKDYQKYIKRATTLDDIMFLYIRGVICED